MIRIALVGLGKIAHDQHIPTLRASSEFEIVAGVMPRGDWPEVPIFRTIEALLASGIEVDALAMCQPPQYRFDATQTALRAGKHVLLEKPPGATLSEVAILEEIARERGVTLFASWHSRYAAGVEQARSWLAGRTVTSARIEWLEDVRHWHPGQTWIWQPGGMGVFDPGINALSIATRILPGFFLKQGSLAIPANVSEPIAADLFFTGQDGFEVHATFDFRQTGPQTWTITVETDDGTLLLTEGGSKLSIAGKEQQCAPEAEYRLLYEHFAELVKAKAMDVDISPLRHVADAYTRADRQQVEAFIE